MPQLIKIIQGEIHTSPIGETTLVKSIVGSIQLEDYIIINGFAAYLQNLTRAQYTKALNKPLTYGLPNNYNIPMVTLEISY
jgi:hypothetical protein